MFKNHFQLQAWQKKKKLTWLSETSVIKIKDNGGRVVRKTFAVSKILVR